MIENRVKLVVWDLDETFWRGTLTEEGIVPIDGNVQIVRELSKRGIVNSICSKNDYDQARAKLTDLNIWEYFVFPRISFNPKGKAIAEMIEEAALRAENVLFIDDNAMNLEEAKFFNPGIMTAHPGDVLETLLEHVHLQGKPDPELTRLKQYQFLQRKVEEQSTTSLSNEEFLRSSNIRVMIDYDIQANFDRIVELINRTNQLNYTKQRLNTPQEIEAFREQLNAFGNYAGCIRATDNYGDYGLIGFFLMRRTPSLKKLIHFVFSCRTMNMGIEQYFYEKLAKPEIGIVQPVSYELDTHAGIDWIAETSWEQAAVGGTARDCKLMLLGGCDLLQLASYCSENRVEFVNTQRNGVVVRFDDSGFLLGDREDIRKSPTIRELPCWTYDDALQFDEAVATSEIILLSLWGAMNQDYFRVDDSIMMRLGKREQEYLTRHYPEIYPRTFKFLDLDQDTRARLVERSIRTIGRQSSEKSRIFLIGCYLDVGFGGGKGFRQLYNKICQTFSERQPHKFRFVDINTIVPPGSLVDRAHFSRAGYFAMARYILEYPDGSGGQAG